MRSPAVSSIDTAHESSHPGWSYCSAPQPAFSLALSSCQPQSGKAGFSIHQVPLVPLISVLQLGVHLRAGHLCGPVLGTKSQELLLLLPLRGPWVRLCWGWGPCGRGCWVSLGGCSPGEGQGEQGIRHSMLFPDHPGLPS